MTFNISNYLHDIRLYEDNSKLRGLKTEDVNRIVAQMRADGITSRDDVDAALDRLPDQPKAAPAAATRMQSAPAPLAKPMPAPAPAPAAKAPIDSLTWSLMTKEEKLAAANANPGAAFHTDVPKRLQGLTDQQKRAMQAASNSPAIKPLPPETFEEAKALSIATGKDIEWTTPKINMSGTIPDGVTPQQRLADHYAKKYGKRGH